ncbi:uncharacterized protein LOC144663653 [Oculina patagonica]
MTSTPSITESLRPRAEDVNPEQESAIGGGQAEPHPEWNKAEETWGAAWKFHQYGLGVSFGILGVFAVIAFLKMLKDNRDCRQKKVSLFVLSQIIIFGFSRCLFLCVDAYHSKSYLPVAVVNLIWGIGHPCLVTAFMLIFLVLRNAVVMKSRFQNWYTTRNIAIVTVPYYIFVFASEVIVSFLPLYKGLIFACQIINTLLYISLALFYTYTSALIRHKLSLMRKGASKTHDRGKQTSAIFKRCIAAAIGGFSIGAMQTYALICIHNVSHNAQYVSPWPWFAFNTSLRCLEIGMSVLLYMTGTQNSAGQQARRRVDVAPMSMMLSKVETQVSKDSEKSDTFKILRLNLQCTYVESDILPLTGAVSVAKGFLKDNSYTKQE